jgi:hypothetical protein
MSKLFTVVLFALSAMVATLPIVVLSAVPATAFDPDNS